MTINNESQIEPNIQFDEAELSRIENDKEKNEITMKEIEENLE